MVCGRNLSRGVFNVRRHHMIHTKKASLLAIISFLVVIGFSVPATTYAYGDAGNFFFPTAQNSVYSQPREQLVVYAFGPSSPPSYNTPQIGSYQPGYTTTSGMHNPAQYSYANLYASNASNYFPQMFQQSYPNFSTFNSKFVNNTYIAPQVMQYGSTPGMGYSNYSYPQTNYGFPQYQPQYSSQQYPSYTSYDYDSYGYGGYAQSTGEKDFWGNDLCNWGDGYAGYPCDRDPHQWIHDPYTDTWY